MSSEECYHFTKLNRAYGIANNGLQPRLEANSKAVNDGDAKISFSDGKVAAAGLYANFCNTYRIMNDTYYNKINPTNKKKLHRKKNPTDKKVITSENIEDYLGEGIYLVFDGTDIENTGGNNNHVNPFDAGTKIPIHPEQLKVCVLRDSQGNIHFSQYDYIKYIIANFTEDDYLALEKIDQDEIILDDIEAFKKEYAEELSLFDQNEYTPELMSLDDFTEAYKTEIDANIREYLQTHYEDTQEEITQIRREFENLPESFTERLDECLAKYNQMMNKLRNSDLSQLDIPLPSFYNLYRKELDEPISQYCNSIIASSQEEIATLRDEVAGMSEYKELFLHSNLHIQNVVEYAYIIGKCENILGDDLDLLVQAAKYHDSAREGSEWLSDNHADASAEHAEIELSGKYTKEQIAMIKVAIRYHEHPEMFKNQFDEDYFMEIAQKEGVPIEKLQNTRLMCVYLKDADALDRVRLQNLDVDYLRTCIAKSDVFLREFGKDKDSISWENAGLAVKRNKDFDMEQEMRRALEKLKEDYSGKDIILQAISKVEKEEEEKTAEGKKGSIFSTVKRIRHILQTEKMVEELSQNLDGIVTSPERQEQYLKLAIRRNCNLDTLKIRLSDVIRLSEIPRTDSLEDVAHASDIEFIEDVKDGMNDNKKVRFSDGENTHTGYFKENIVPVFNDTSLAVNKIGELLGINMAKTYACEYEGKHGVISQDVSEGFDKFMMMDEVIEKSKLPKIMFPKKTRASATKYNPTGMVTSEEKIAEMFEYPLKALETIGASKDDMEDISIDYVKMICFDYLTNQTDRNDGNYGVLVKDGKYSFAPLIDCDYVLHDPTDTDNNINFTSSVRCDRDVLMRVVASKYPDLVQEFFQSALENKEKIFEIIQNSFSPEMQEKYGSIVDINIQNLQSIIEQTKGKEISNNSHSTEAFTRSSIAVLAKQAAMEDVNSGEIFGEFEKTQEAQITQEQPNPHSTLE